MSYYMSSDFDPHAACESRETFLYSNTLLRGRQCSYDGDNNVEECYVDIGACENARGSGPGECSIKDCNQPTNQPTRQASRFRIRVGEEALRSRRVRELRQRSNYLSVKWNSSLRSFIKTFTIGFERPVDKSRKQYRRAIVSKSCGRLRYI
ncbi:uncharacterized protein LOC105681001 [Bombus impatiens]|uniref:Uncharacterized protein LOC105681001 n=1 Tax=Bombus impatiens TaxID=132113 RepID=A0A6P8L7J7_BOMIM|nr:uncharacterized protein LOC105681001 [Bombus impatiens]